MGPSSGGAGNSGGNGEYFDANTSDLPRRRGSMDEAGRQRYYDSYWNRSYSINQRAWSTEDDQQQRGLQTGYGFFTVIVSLAIFLSTWMLYGLYGNQQLEMGIFYSRVVTANSFFVKKIQVRNLKEIGPAAYSFSTRPKLDSPVSDKQEMEDIVVDPRWQKRFMYWFNKGSYLELSCSLNNSGSGAEGLIVAIVKGEDGFQDWKEDPDNPSLALRWKRIHDQGKLSLKVVEDDDYCIVFGNLNNRRITFTIKLVLRYVLHSKENADLVCPFQLSGTCEFPVALGQSAYVLLTSPAVNLHRVEVWHTQLSYVPRWITYIFLWATVAAGLLFARAFKLRQATLQTPITHELPPQIPKEDSHYAPLAPAYPVTQGDPTFKNEKASVLPSQLCSICLDAPKDSFFDPCGHCYTCYTCGIRIQKEDSSRCPICRHAIRTVRRIYDA